MDKQEDLLIEALAHRYNFWRLQQEYEQINAYWTGLDAGTRISHVLAMQGVSSIRDAVQMTDNELLRFENFGKVSLARLRSILKVNTMKKPVKSTYLRDSARGQQCTLQIPGHCNNNPETTVLCHFQFRGGKMGGKENDISAGFGCYGCHQAIDQSLTLDKFWYMARSMVRTQEIWVKSGLLTVKGFKP